MGIEHASKKCPLVVHVIHRLAIGGMENGLVNLINNMPADRMSHAVVCLSDVTDFRDRLVRPDVDLYALRKQEGKDFGVHRRLWKLLRRLRPDIVHTRNLATIECQLPAFLAGGAIGVHGEHGWDVKDLDGTRRKARILRRCMRPFIRKYVAVSAHIETYLRDVIGVNSDRLCRIYNGVDTTKFHPVVTRLDVPLQGKSGRSHCVFGTVGRLQRVKDQATLLRAFAAAREVVPGARLIVVGDGPLRPELERIAHDLQMQSHIWFAGARNDVAEVLREIDVFVLPSLAEGISNTMLEAMATGLPVVATYVGGNSELIVEGETGALVPPADVTSLASALVRYAKDDMRRRTHGLAARRRAETFFGIQRMVSAYLELYESLLYRRGVTRRS